MNKILFISSVDIYLRNGAGLATLAYYNAFCSLYPNKVDLFIPEESISNSCLNKNCYGIRKRNKFYTPYYLLFGKLHRVKKSLIPFLKKNNAQYNICVINGGVIAGDMINKIKSLGLKVIVIHHNYEKEYHMDNKSKLTFYGYFPYYVIRNEKNAYKYADLNLFITENDFHNFLRNYGNSYGKSAIIGCFEYEKTNPHKISNNINSNYIAISGAMDSYQTIKGIEDVRMNYFKILNLVIPKLNLIITGRNPSSLIYKFRNENPNHIKIIANPENIFDTIKNSGIFYCPTSIGSGLKLRLMDGLKLGMPILTHSKSSKGYESFFNKYYFKVYDSKETFMTNLNSLYKLLINNKIDRSEIQNDYYKYFGFESGVSRLKIIMSDCFHI